MIPDVEGDSIIDLVADLDASSKENEVPPSAIVDIVILTNSQSKWLDLCVRSVEHHTVVPYRLIVVDSASKGTAMEETLKGIASRGHTVIRLPENRSFSNGINVGVGLGSSKFICILNDDCIVTEGWMDALIQDASDKSVGLVGSRSNYAAGAQGDPSFIGEPPFLVFVCVALRRSTWEAVGPLDEENFTGFSGEDLDYSWRVKKAGLRLKVSGGSYVLHAGSRSLINATAGNIDAMRKNNEKYHEVLVSKHGREFVAASAKTADRILVCSFHPNDWTRVRFVESLIWLKRSDGVTFEYLYLRRMPIHHARQAAADYATDNGFDAMIFLDDDSLFPPDTIKRLLSHGKQVVTALAYQRKPPHLPCVFELGEDGVLGRPLEGIEKTGLRKIDTTGLHVALIKADVFRKMRAANIRLYFGGFDNKVGEDIAFALNCKKVGIQVYTDTDIEVGHLGEEVNVDQAYRAAWAMAQQQKAAQAAAPSVVIP